jgi:hypothetical protein
VVIAAVQGEATAWADASRQEEDDEKHQQRKGTLDTVGVAGGDNAFEVENPVFNE